MECWTHSVFSGFYLSYVVEGMEASDACFSLNCSKYRKKTSKSTATPQKQVKSKKFSLRSY